MDWMYKGIFEVNLLTLKAKLDHQKEKALKEFPNQQLEQRFIHGWFVVSLSGGLLEQSIVSWNGWWSQNVCTFAKMLKWMEQFHVSLILTCPRPQKFLYWQAIRFSYAWLGTITHIPLVVLYVEPCPEYDHQHSLLVQPMIRDAHGKFYRYPALWHSRTCIHVFLGLFPHCCHQNAAVWSHFLWTAMTVWDQTLIYSSSVNDSENLVCVDMFGVFYFHQLGPCHPHRYP